MASPHEIVYGDRMTDPLTKPVTADEKEILALVERWSQAVRNGDRAGIASSTMLTS
jgi:hypothetical protein